MPCPMPTRAAPKARSAVGGRAPSYSDTKNWVVTCSGRVIDVVEVRAGRFGVIQRRNRLEALEGLRGGQEHLRSWCRWPVEGVSGQQVVLTEAWWMYD